MAFPVTGVLDSFNAGALQNLSARAGWSASDHVISGAGDLTTDAVPTYASGGGNNGNAWATTFNDCEVWVTFAVLPNPNFVNLYARWNTAANSGYELTFFPVGGGSFNVGATRRDSGSGTSLGSTSPTLSAGDSIGLSCIGSAVTSYYKQGAGAWTQSATATDATYVSGVLGIYGNDSTYHVDAFGGGDPGPGPLVGANFLRKGDRRT